MLKLLLIIGVLLFFGAKLLPGLGSMLGHRSRKPFRQARWMWSWFAGSEAEALQAEREYGRECAREFAAQFPGRASQGANDIVKAVAARLAATVKKTNYQFDFRVVRAGASNAFALPGGFVFITESLIDLCARDEDEIAFLLGHEVAHVTLGHAREQLTADTLLKAVAGRLPGAGALLRNMLAKGYSRQLELDADREGSRLAAAAGFDPQAAARALQRLAQVAPVDPGLAEYFSSHPPLAERIRSLKQGAAVG